MSARVPLPLRWLRVPPSFAGASVHSSDNSSTAAALSPSSIVSVYKPSGLPYFSTSQTAAAARHPRRLFTLEPHHAGGPQPRPQAEDTSDSLSARLTDALPLGATPYLTLPIPSSLSLPPYSSLSSSAAAGSGGNAANTAGIVNAQTARYKGVTLVSLAQGEALLVRNAARMGMVVQTYHVLVKLPAGIQRNAQAHSMMQQQQKGQSGTGSRFLNPYVRAAAERASRRQVGNFISIGADHGSGGMEGSLHGIPISDPATGALPPALRHEALLGGGLVSWAHAQLRRSGYLSAFLRPAVPLPAPLQRVARMRRRLAGLFVPSPSQGGPPSSATDGLDEAADEETDSAPTDPHPWMPPTQRLVISVEASTKRSRGDGRRQNRNAQEAAPGHRVHVTYRLLAIGGGLENSGSSTSKDGVALYEVRGAHVSPEEVAALFAAEGFYPVNDYTFDTDLAELLVRTAEEMRRQLSVTAQVGMPMALRHRLEAATPEELVALPLLRQPLLAADGCAVGALASALTRAMAEGSGCRTGMFAAGGTDELLEKLRKNLVMDAGGGAAASGTVDGTRQELARPVDHLAHLLYTTLARSRRLSDADVASLMQLTLGAGVECINIRYPDPATVSTVLTLQHAAARFEEGNLSAREREELMLSMQLVDTGSGAATSLSVAQGLVAAPRGLSLAAAAAAGGGGNVTHHNDTVEDVALSYALVLSDSGRNAGERVGGEAAAAFRFFATLLEAADVPAVYEPLIRHWRARQGLEEDALCNGRAEAEAAVLPSRSLLRRLLSESSTSGRSDATAKKHCVGHDANEDVQNNGEVLSTSSADIATTEAGDNERNSATQGLRPTMTPLFIRAEELGCYHCVACGGPGHTWQCCPVTGLADLSALPTTMTGATAIASSAAAPIALLTAKRITETPTELMKSTREAGSALRAQEEHRAQLASTAAVAGDYDSEDPLVVVTNPAPTAALNIHALRRERAKPPMQRRSLRCAYCHGRHHISQCPKLEASAEGGMGGADGLLAAVGPSGNSSELSSGGPVVTGHSRISVEPERLFCIKCGRLGHLFTSCPRLPVNLHTATHCPICQQSIRRGQHTPVQCPRRVSLPSVTTYFPSGVPRDCVLEAAGAVANPQRGSSGVDRVATFEARAPETDAKGGRRETLHRRRRRSMLTADSLVDRR